MKGAPTRKRDLRRAKGQTAVKASNVGEGTERNYWSEEDWEKVGADTRRREKWPNGNIPPRGTAPKRCCKCRNAGRSRHTHNSEDCKRRYQPLRPGQPNPPQW